MSNAMTDIFYMQIEIIYKKGKTVVTKQTWMVSTYNKPNAIMSNDIEGMARLSSRIFGSLKTKSDIVIRKVLSSKVIGFTTIVKNNSHE
jgi:hypothetical protein